MVGLTATRMERLAPAGGGLPGLHRTDPCEFERRSEETSVIQHGTWNHTPYGFMHESCTHQMFDLSMKQPFLGWFGVGTGYHGLLIVSATTLEYVYGLGFHDPARCKCSAFDFLLLRTRRNP